MSESERQHGIDLPRVAHAFAPGHITGIFSPATEARDPRARGSRGAGIVLELGAWAEARWVPGRRPHVDLASDLERELPISGEVASRLLGPRRGTLSVRLRHELPVGQGFGMSAAGALSTALACARVLDLPAERGIEVAHLSDLYGHGGLGGVSAVLEGGWERRLTPGIPPHGRSIHRPFSRPVWIALLGPPLPSPRLLGDAKFLETVRRAATGGLRHLARRPTEGVFLSESERFSDRVGIAPPRLGRTVRSLRRSGAWSGQAMFGRSVWAVPRSRSGRSQLVRALSRLGVRAVELSASRTGAWSADGELAPPRESLLNRPRLARLP